MSITLKEIRVHQASEFKNMKDQELVEAYGTVNVFKKEFSDLEKDIKEAIIKRSEDKSGFTKPVQLSLSFPTGDVDYSVNPVDKEIYSLDISEKDFYNLLVAEGLNPEHYMKVEYKISQTSLARLMHSKTSISSHIKKTSQTSLKFTTKKVDK